MCADFDGNSKISSYNIHAYPSVYGTRCLFVGAQLLPPKGYAEGYHDNTCILPSANDTYFQIQGIEGGGCLEGASAKAVFENGLVSGNNTLYVPSGRASVKCGTAEISMAEFLAAGYDVGTTVSADVPSPTQIIAMATSLLRG